MPNLPWIVSKQGNQINYVSEEKGSCNTYPETAPFVTRGIQKSLLLTYMALHGKAPPYIELFLTYAPFRALRSSTKHLLTVHTCRSRTPTYGSRCFKFAEPILWNALPLSRRKASSLASLKRSLKTHLFKPRQLCWAGFILMLLCVCVSVCVSFNKISQKVFNQSSSFFGGSLHADTEMK